MPEQALSTALVGRDVELSALEDEAAAHGRDCRDQFRVTAGTLLHEGEAGMGKTGSRTIWPTARAIGWTVLWGALLRGPRSALPYKTACPRRTPSRSPCPPPAVTEVVPPPRHRPGQVRRRRRHGHLQSRPATASTTRRSPPRRPRLATAGASSPGPARPIPIGIGIAVGPPSSAAPSPARTYRAWLDDEPAPRASSPRPPLRRDRACAPRPDPPTRRLAPRSGRL